MIEALIERDMLISPPIFTLSLRVKIEKIVNKIISLYNKIVQKGEKVMPVEKNQTVEIIKELGRWAILLTVSWIITQTLDQVVNVPETFLVKVWVFNYLIPVRLLFQLALSSLGRAIDRWIHENKSIKANGLIPF